MFLSIVIMLSACFSNLLSIVELYDLQIILNAMEKVTFPCCGYDCACFSNNLLCRPAPLFLDKISSSETYPQQGHLISQYASLELNTPAHPLEVCTLVCCAETLRVSLDQVLYPFTELIPLLCSCRKLSSCGFAFFSCKHLRSFAISTLSQIRIYMA